MSDESTRWPPNGAVFAQHISKLIGAQMEWTGKEHSSDAFKLARERWAHEQDLVARFVDRVLDMERRLAALETWTSAPR